MKINVYGNDPAGVFSPAGELLHLSDPAAEADLVYIIETEPDHTELLTAAQFRARIGKQKSLIGLMDHRHTCSR